MGHEPLADVRRAIALEVLADWVRDLLQTYPRDVHLPCGHCLREAVLDLPWPGETVTHYRRRLKQRGYQRRYRQRKLARGEAK